MPITHERVKNVRVADHDFNLLDIHADLIRLAARYPESVVDLESSEHMICIERCPEELMLEIAAQLPRYVGEQSQGRGFAMNGTTLEIW